MPKVSLKRRLDYAIDYIKAGLSVLPIKADGSKAPALGTWKEFQQRLATEDELRGWYADNRLGIGLVGGAVSGNLECIDFDRGALFAPWCELVEMQAPGLVAKLCVVQTPREPAGYHAWYRCPEATIPGNCKLAQEPGTDPKTGKPCLITLIETRGEGGYALVPGSPPACHETGNPYRHHSGPRLTSLSGITVADREILTTAARTFDLAAAAKTKRPAIKLSTSGGGLRPGDDYDRRGPDWGEILEPHGWARAQVREEVVYWRRPGKQPPGISATTGHCKGRDGADLLAVFSSNAYPFEGPNGTGACTCYSKFAAFALLNHDGDFNAAAQELAKQGYGAAGAGGGTVRPDGEPDEWAPIIPLVGEVPVPAFPADVLPAPLKKLVEEIGWAMNCPADYPGLILLALAGGTIGNSRKLAITKTYKESASLYAAYVGRPGTTKTAPLKLLRRPLDQVQEDFFDQYKQEMKTWKEAKKAAKGQGT